MALKLLKFGINIVSIELLLLISLKLLNCLVFAKNWSEFCDHGNFMMIL